MVGIGIGPDRVAGMLLQCIVCLLFVYRTPYHVLSITGTYMYVHMCIYADVNGTYMCVYMCIYADVNGHFAAATWSIY